MAYTSPVGQIFGRLTVECQASGKSQRFYECLCVCGGRKTVSIYDLRRGFTQSCGCLYREARTLAGKLPKTHMVNDLTGRVFGMLTVVERRSNTKYGTTAWLVRCECGEEKVSTGNHLITGQVASCGCAYRARKVVRSAARRGQQNAYVQQRYRSDLPYALNRRLLQLIHASLRVRGSKKSIRWESAVGYPLADLQTRLEATMPDGCTWADFLAGRLHIDHIRPLSSFKFQSEVDPQFRAAWALSNLQLLLEADNLKKGCTWSPVLAVST